MARGTVAAAGGRDDGGGAMVESNCKLELLHKQCIVIKVQFDLDPPQ